MSDAGKPDRERVLLWLILAVFVVVRVMSLDRYDLWFDELFSVGVGLGGWSDTLARAAADQTNPPLFYILVKAWTLVAPVSAVPLRILPLAFGIAGTGALLALARALKLEGWAKLSLLALGALSPQLIFYSVELRAYALLFLLGTVTLTLTLKLVRTADTGHRAPNTEWLVLTLINTLLVYTHYFGWFTVLAEGAAVMLLRRDLLTRALASGTVTGLLFLPWALAVRAAGQAKGEFGSTIAWVDKPGLLSVVGAPGAVIGGTLTGIGLAAGVIVLFSAVILLLRQRDARTLTLLSFIVMPMACAFAVSWLTSRSIWVDRNFIAAAAPVLAILVLSVQGRRLALVTASLVLAQSYAVVTTGDAKIRWSALAERIQNGSDEGMSVYAFEGFTAIPLQYYLGRYPGARRVSVTQSFDSLRAGPGWVVARDGAWPGTGGLPVALRQHGRDPGDWVRLSAPGQEIQAAGYR